jgi:hypothetical protein
VLERLTELLCEEIRVILEKTLEKESVTLEEKIGPMILPFSIKTALKRELPVKIP